MTATMELNFDRLAEPQPHSLELQELVEAFLEAVPEAKDGTIEFYTDYDVENAPNSSHPAFGHEQEVHIVARLNDAQHTRFAHFIGTSTEHVINYAIDRITEGHRS